MNLRTHVRRNVAVAVAAIAVALGAAGAAQADTAVAHESVATDLPSATAPAPAPNANAAHLTLVTASAPTAPRSPTATAGNARVKLAWLAPSSNGGATINKYRVQRATSAAGPWTRIATPTARSHTARGLSNGTRYHFRIAAHNAAGWGPYSTVVNTVPRTVPSAPQSTATTPGNGSVTVIWVEPASTGGATIKKYRVQRATSSNGPWMDIAFTTAVLGFNDTGLANGTQYYFRVAARNAAGWGPYATIVSAVPRTVPSAPLICSATQEGIFGGSHTMRIEWQPPYSDGGAPISNYQVTLIWADGASALIIPPGVYEHEFQLPYGDYQVSVDAINAAGHGPGCADDVTLYP